MPLLLRNFRLRLLGSFCGLKNFGYEPRPRQLVARGWMIRVRVLATNDKLVPTS